MTRLRMRKDDPLRQMKAEMAKLPWPQRACRDMLVLYGDFYQNITFSALYRRQGEFNADFVYHYTSIEVFEKLIASGGDLLLTRFDELNDDSEFEYGWDTVMDYLSWHYHIRGHKLGLFWRELNKRREEGGYIPWVMSFSEAPDSLYQWSMYTSREQGGCSIAFDFRELNYVVESIRKAEHREFDVCFLPCLYDSDEKNRVLKVWAARNKEALNCLENLSYFDLKKRQDELVKPLLADIFMLAAIIKHYSFKFEREWRLLVMPKTNATIKTRQKQFELGGKHRYGFNACFSGAAVPLFSTRWIRGVGISPHPRKTRSDRFWHAFDAFCAVGRKQSETGIWQSDVPYNGR